MRKSAFTMIELLVVLAIIAVIATISIPTIDAMTSPKHVLRKEGRKVMQMMSEARLEAMARKVQIDLRIDPETGEVRMVEALAFRALMQELDSRSDEGALTNRYEKVVSFKEGIGLDAFTADQIIDADAGKDEMFGRVMTPSKEVEPMERVAVSFSHFGGSNGGGISLLQDGVRLDIAADLLTGRPRIVKRESAE